MVTHAVGEGASVEASVGQMPISSSDAVVRPPSWQRSLPRLQPQAPLQSRGHMIDVHDVPGLAVGASVEQDPIASSELVVRPPLTHALAFLLQPQAPAQSRGHEISAQVATGLANGAGVGATDGDGDSGARDRVEMVGDTVGAADPHTISSRPQTRSASMPLMMPAVPSQSVKLRLGPASTAWPTSVPSIASHARYASTGPSLPALSKWICLFNSAMRS